MDNAQGDTPEVVLLRQKLQTMTEWHERAEAQLAQLMRLPDQTRTLRQRVENPDIAIPLLQNYDSTILEKDAELQRLRVECDRLKEALHARAASSSDAVASARLAEEKARVSVDEANLRCQAAEGEVAQLRAHIARQDEELLALKQRVSALVVSESRLKDGVQRLAKAKEEAEAERDELAGKCGKLTDAHSSAVRRVESIKQQADEEKQGMEANKIQLHLLTKENDDKVHEIERLRDKMVAALRQASDNHATHLRLVEQKHQSTIENFHEQLRVAEVQNLRLKAQLSRVDVRSGSLELSPSAVVDAQVRQAQEMELKRLYAENSTLRMQLDDATFKIEHMQSSRSRLGDERLRELQMHCDALTKQKKDLEERLARQEAETLRGKEALKSLHETHASVVGELEAAGRERSDALRKSEEMRKRIAQLESQESQIQSEARDAVEGERRKIRTLEQQLEEARHIEHAAKESQSTALAELKRMLDEARAGQRDLTAKLNANQSQLRDKERLLEIAETKAEKLTQGLTLHKQQLTAYDERMGQALSLEAQRKAELKDLAIQCERLRMDVVKIARERDRLASEVNAINSVNRRLAAA